MSGHCFSDFLSELVVEESSLEDSLFGGKIEEFLANPVQTKSALLSNSQDPVLSMMSSSNSNDGSGFGNDDEEMSDFERFLGYGTEHQAETLDLTIDRLIDSELVVSEEKPSPRVPPSQAPVVEPRKSQQKNAGRSISRAERFGRNSGIQEPDSTQKSPAERPKRRYEFDQSKVKNLGLAKEEQDDLITFLTGGKTSRKLPGSHLKQAAELIERSSEASGLSFFSPGSRSASRMSSGGSKQAEYARMYRQKNKNFVEQLQSRIDDLEEVNKLHQDENQQLKESVLDLQSEVTYLRSLLANDSEISSLIQGLSNVPGMKLRFGSVHTSEVAIPVGAQQKRKNSAESSDSRESMDSKRLRRGGTKNKPGICLHVQDDDVSVEFCGRCNRSSRFVEKD